MDVTAPVKKATVVYQCSPRSTHKKMIAAIRMMKIAHILYSAVMKAEAPFLMMAPI